MKLKFAKMHGCGNDFLVCEAMSRPLTLAAARIRELGDRHFGVGFDQLLMIEPPLEPDSDFGLAIFNSDGSPAGHCGNGARCVARLVFDDKLTHKHALKWDIISGDALTGSFVTRRLAENSFEVEVGVPRVSIETAPPALKTRARQVDEFIWSAGDVEFTPVSLGNPHAVVMVKDASRAEVTRIAGILEGVNVGFCQTVSRQRLKLRVHERGAGETLACGSGACAAAAAAIVLGRAGASVLLEVAGGELQVEWPGPEEMIRLRGPAELSFRGSLDL